MPLRIGVNALYLLPGGVGGTEIYLRNLLRALAGADPLNDYYIITNRETSGLAVSAHNMHELRQPITASVRAARILWEQAALPCLAAHHRFDVLFNPGFTAPLICLCPQVTVFHDLQHKRHPEYFRRFDLPFWNVLLYSAAHRSTRLIAVSEATRQDLLHYYRRDATVVPHGVEPAFFDIASQRAPEPFLLCVSTLHPHKGIVDLLGAFAKFRSECPRFRLVLAGMRGFAAAAVQEQIRLRDLNESVEITGWIPREQLYDLYRRAWAFVYPSRFEGFGMPVSEAMAAGVPLACSDIEPLRSLADGAALLFTAGNERSIEAALHRITGDEDLRATLIAVGRARAQKFTWESAAAGTLAVLHETALQRRERR